MSLDSLAHRVARRHSGALALRDVPYTSPQILFADGGVVTADDVRRVLEDRVSLTGLSFCPTCSSSKANITLWEGIRSDGKVVSGKLVLHAGAAIDHVVMWAEIVLDPDEDDPVPPAPSNPLGEIAYRARRLVARLRKGKLPLREVVAAIAGIVDVAKGADPRVP